MLVYRIVLAKWSENLTASGKEGRWNPEGNKVIYTASSRSLACLENLVHRSGRGLNELFKVLVISLPDSVKFDIVRVSDLSGEWTSVKNQEECRKTGDEWYRKGESCVLEVPSSLIPEEANYIINTMHRDFKKVKIISRQNFIFDPRLRITNDHE